MISDDQGVIQDEDVDPARIAAVVLYARGAGARDYIRIRYEIAKCADEQDAARKWAEVEVALEKLLASTRASSFGLH